MTTREILIANGVRNLKEFGYPGVTKENILTDPIYREFFIGNLEGWSSHPKVAADVYLLLKELEGRSQ